MKLIERLFGGSGDPVVLDHVAPQSAGHDWRDEAIKRAAARYGKAFKCAAPQLDREVISISREITIVKGLQ